MTAIASIIIPAHQEEATIGRCLAEILAGAMPGEFQIIVAANGCSDRTAEIARSFADVEVLELAEGNKVKALRAAKEAARHFPRIYLDADLAMDTRSIRALIQPLMEGRALAAIGRMDVDVTHSSWAVWQYYRAWRMHPYFDNGKFGGVYGLSRLGEAKVGELPLVTNDDEFVARQFAQEEVAFVPQSAFVAKAPAALSDLIKVRCRVRRGNRELAAGGVWRRQPGQAAFLRRILLRPHLWAGFAVYACVNIAAALRSRHAPASGWERDDSSRKLSHGAA